MHNNAYQKLLNTLNAAIEPLSEQEDRYSSLVEKIGDARFVLIGEATHGTHEFYQTRAEITYQLIKQKGFMAIAIEGDWPDAYRVHRYLQGVGDKKNVRQALEGFTRFPAWMWRNETVASFLESLRNYNDALISPNIKMGFYGLDLYSLSSSMHAVIDYLLKIDPDAAQRAQARYACFDHLQTEPQTYGYLTSLGVKKSCIKEAIEQLLELQNKAVEYMRQDGFDAEEEYFYAAQNARLIKDAEAYYRSMFEGRVSSWNVRDTHMAETLNAIANHLEKRAKKPAKIIVWAHNSHIGDARATEVVEQGEINIGQLAREQYDADAYLLGFSTYQGTVTAASAWGAPAERKTIKPGFESSYEEVFHHLKDKNFFLDLTGNYHQLEHLLKLPRLQRAIGVIYRPETERLSHYYYARLLQQFNGVIHLDQTTAVQAL
jgi:erythromycin esterase-like protein